MPKSGRLSAQVTWSTTGVPAWRKALRTVPTVLGLGLDLVTPGSIPSLGDGDDLDPGLNTDAAEPLGHVAVTGRGGGLPAAYPSSQVVAVYADRATIMLGLEELVLPLSTLRITHASPTGIRWTRRKAADAIWTVRAEGTNVDLTFRGRWLLLAQLGTLAGWSEPV